MRRGGCLGTQICTLSKLPTLHCACTLLCRNMGEYKAITIAGQLSVLTKLQTAVQALLDSLPTTMEQDKLLYHCLTQHQTVAVQSSSLDCIIWPRNEGAEAGGNLGADRSRLAAAVAYRLERKRCLTTVLQVVQQMHGTLLQST